METQVSQAEIDKWRADCRQLLQTETQKNVAESLGITEGHLSKVLNGKEDKSGKPRNPGAILLKNFYMKYPQFNRSPDAGESNWTYDFTSKALDSFKEAQLRYIERTDQLIDLYKDKEDLHQKRFDKMIDIGVTMSETQKLSVVNQGAMISSHGKMVDAHCVMTKDIHLLVGELLASGKKS